MVRRHLLFPVGIVAAALVLFLGGQSLAQKAATPGADAILGGFRPVHPVEIDTPDKADWPKCKVELITVGKGNGYLVTGTQGQTLRRFLDTDGNQAIDQYRYYKDGMEVYRELDTTGDKNSVSIDQCRWFNGGGTRWGLDANKDGIIDQWKVISAEEVSMEAVRALVTGDARILAPILATVEDLTAVGVDKTAQAETLKWLVGPENVLKELRKGSKVVQPTTKWMQFSCSMPYMIPAEAGRSTQDLYVYENAIAIVQNGTETGSIHLGEIIRVGNAWKLTVMPRPVESQETFTAEGGSLFQYNAPLPAAATAQNGGLKPEVQALLEAIQKLDQAQPGAGATLAEVEKYHTARFQYISKLVAASDSPEEKESWQRQLIEGIFAATQIGAYSGGMAELAQMEAKYAKTPKNPLYPFVLYRRLLTTYSVDQQEAVADADRPKVQENFLKSLEKFAEDFPKADDRPDALLQLALTHDLSARAPEAAKWYQMILADHPESVPASRAKGSIARLSLKGKKLNLSGPLLGGGKYDPAAHRGKVLVVTYWSTYCGPCTQELPTLIELHKAQAAHGFEVQGVCLDNPGAPIQEFLQQHKVPWSHIYDEGGMEGQAALSYGIVTLPTILIIDRDGTVAAVTTSMADVKKFVPELLKKQP